MCAVNYFSRKWKAGERGDWNSALGARACVCMWACLMKPELKLNNKNGGRKEAQVYCAAFLLVLVRSGGKFPLEQLKCFAGGGGTGPLVPLVPFQISGGRLINSVDEEREVEGWLQDHVQVRCPTQLPPVQVTGSTHHQPEGDVV